MQTSRKKTALAAIVFTFMMASGAMAPCTHAGEQEQDGPPKAIFHQTRYEFGTIMEGQEIRHDFIVENRGQAPLIIERVQPD